MRVSYCVFITTSTEGMKAVSNLLPFDIYMLTRRQSTQYTVYVPLWNQEEYYSWLPYFILKKSGIGVGIYPRDKNLSLTT